MTTSSGGSKFRVTVGGNFLAALTAFEAEIHQKWTRALVRYVVDMNRRVMARTPVWEGDTVRNWHWSVGRPSLRHDQPIPEPTDPSDGGTAPSRRALGSEPRRSVNEEAQREEFYVFLHELTASKTPPAVIYLTNTAETAIDLEYGRIGRKAPAGMLRVSLAETLLAMGAV